MCEPPALGTQVEVQGLKSRADLNGKRGWVTAYDAAADRVEVSFDGQAKVKVKLDNAVPVKGLQSEADGLKVGDCVEILGLQSRADLNGRRGSIVSRDLAAGRVEVKLDGLTAGERIKVKPSNVKVAKDGIAVGVHVEIMGLESRSDLNGRRGVIVARETMVDFIGNDRLEVHLDGADGGERVKCKPSNVKPVSAKLDLGAAVEAVHAARMKAQGRRDAGFDEHPAPREQSTTQRDQAKAKPDDPRWGEFERDRPRDRDRDREQDRKPDRSRERDRKPDQPREPDRKPDRSRERDRKPDQPREQDRRPERSRERDRKRDQSSEQDRRPDRSRERDRKPGQSREQDRRPDRSREKDRRPDRLKENDQRPDQSREKDRKPERSRERDRKPERSRERDRKPERSRERDRKPERSRSKPKSGIEKPAAANLNYDAQGKDSVTLRNGTTEDRTRDWVCKCGERNFMRRSQCHRCHAQRATDAPSYLWGQSQIDQQMQKPKWAGDPKGSRPMGGPLGDWTTAKGLLSQDDFDALRRRVDERLAKKGGKKKSRSSSSSSSSSSSESSGRKRKKRRSRSESSEKSFAQLESKVAQASTGLDKLKNEALQKLLKIKDEPPEMRKKAWRTLLLEWHPDKHPDDTENVTAVFQFLQKGKALLDLKGSS